MLYSKFYKHAACSSAPEDSRAVLNRTRLCGRRANYRMCRDRERTAFAGLAVGRGNRRATLVSRYMLKLDVPLRETAQHEGADFRISVE